jgi:hypothetical protein
MASARGFSLLVAILASVGKWITVALLMTHNINAVGQAFVPFLIAEGLLFPALGYLSFQAKSKAMAGLMALWTIDTIVLSLAYVQFQAAAWGFYVHPVTTTLPLVLILLGWAYCMHPFFLARCVERERTRAA